jgi:hypothetical protein
MKRAPWITGRVLLTATARTSVSVSINRPARWTEKQLRGCLGKNMQGKRQHGARDAAMKHRRSLIIAGKANPSTLQAYLCQVCGYWHVGNRRADRP